MLLLGSCGEDIEGSLPSSTRSAEYIVLAWNDLGMHCLNPSYDTAVILPPYNTVWAQVVRRGAIPELVTEGLTVEYRLVGNTSSSGKSDRFGGDYAQFWTYVNALFGATLELDHGLNLREPTVSNGLSGSMALAGDHFQVDGIPVVPVGDDGVWNPFQDMEILVKDASGTVLASTHAMVPTSDEINCARCHGDNAFADILEKHDEVNGQKLSQLKPVLCASCHGSPALGTSGPGTAKKYLSEAIHGAHASRGATCYDCHPGKETQCSRSLRHTGADGNCSSCHGPMEEVASSIETGRVPWLTEPTCVQCHSANIAQIDTGATLYRNAMGHGELYCAACHSSPHAQIPSREALDNHQSKQYMGKALSMGSCALCHPSSRGGGSSEFGEVHGGSSPEVVSACGVCHTQVPSNNTALWPHQFQWKAR